MQNSTMEQKGSANGAFGAGMGRETGAAPSKGVAPTATLCGDISIGPGCRVMHGASVIAEGGKIAIVNNVLFSKMLL